MPHEARIIDALRHLALPLEGLRLDPANARRHPGRNIEAIKGSLARFGQQRPIVVGKDGVVIAGNGTVEAARLLGWTEIAAVTTGLSGADRVAFAIADNRSAELAEWDDPVLADLLGSLDSDAMQAAGFSRDEFETLLSTLGADIKPIEAPSLRSGEREPFQQMTFIVTDEQAEVIREAIEAAKAAGPFDATGNDNVNGNAIARIAESYRG